LGERCGKMMKIAVPRRFSIQRTIGARPRTVKSFLTLVRQYRLRRLQVPRRRLRRQSSEF
jgi:hypothetical protein